jgi:hypothetical protein
MMKLTKLLATRLFGVDIDTRPQKSKRANSQRKVMRGQLSSAEMQTVPEATGGNGSGNLGVISSSSGGANVVGGVSIGIAANAAGQLDSVAGLSPGAGAGIDPSTPPFSPTLRVCFPLRLELVVCV